MRARLPTHRNRRAQMTIAGRGTVKMQRRKLSATALVIIVTGIFAHDACAQTTTLAGLTTSNAPPAQTPPILTTVVIDGSSAYDAAALFATYRDQLGRPVSREGARAIVDALLARYEQDGYVRPEIRLDDSLTGRGVLRVRLFEAQLTDVLLEGDAGRYQAQLEEIAARLEGARPLRKDDVPEALRAMRQIAGLTVTASTRKDSTLPNAFALVVKS